MKKFLPIMAGIVLLFLFVAFTFMVRSDSLRQFDFDVTVKLQDKLPEKAYNYLNLISIPAGFEFITGLFLVILLLTRKWLRLIVSFAVYGGAHVLELIGKMILSQPPPQYMFYKLQSNAWFPDNYRPEGNSFPSGHSFRAFFFAIVIGFLVLRSNKLPAIFRYFIIASLIGFAVLVAVAKVALGQHWATDVIAGFFLGMGSALVAVGIGVILPDRSSSKKISDSKAMGHL